LACERELNLLPLAKLKEFRKTVVAATVDFVWATVVVFGAVPVANKTARVSPGAQASTLMFFRLPVHFAAGGCEP
jgi:hypothetical protein